MHNGLFSFSFFQFYNKILNYILNVYVFVCCADLSLFNDAYHHLMYLIMYNCHIITIISSDFVHKDSEIVLYYLQPERQTLYTEQT